MRRKPREIRELLVKRQFEYVIALDDTNLLLSLSHIFCFKKLSKQKHRPVSHIPSENKRFSNLNAFDFEVSRVMCFRDK